MLFVHLRIGLPLWLLPDTIPSYTALTGNKVISGKSKGLSTEDSKFCLVFKGSSLKQKKATYTPGNRIIFDFYELNAEPLDLNSNVTWWLRR